MSAVTHRRKCYVFVCAGCDLLSYSERSDAITCSTKCRVRAHRNGWLKTLHAIADSFDIHPSGILHCKAIERLRPDLTSRIAAGSLTIADAQKEVWPAFWTLLRKQMDEVAA